jgi:hypothetical protein
LSVTSCSGWPRPTAGTCVGGGLPAQRRLLRRLLCVLPLLAAGAGPGQLGGGAWRSGLADGEGHRNPIRPVSSAFVRSGLRRKGGSTRAPRHRLPAPPSAGRPLGRPFRCSPRRCRDPRPSPPARRPQAPGRPARLRRDRLYLAALSRALPRQRWSWFLIRPQTLLRWHRELVPRKWTHHHGSTGGRPAIAPEVRELILRIGRENPRWDACGSRESSPSSGEGLGDGHPNAAASPWPRPGPRWSGPTWSHPQARVPRLDARGWPPSPGAVLCEYVAHYNARRPHRGLDLRAPDAPSHPPAPAGTPRGVRRRDALGGLIHEYELAA